MRGGWNRLVILGGQPSRMCSAGDVRDQWLFSVSATPTLQLDAPRSITNACPAGMRTSSRISLSLYRRRPISFADCEHTWRSALLRGRDKVRPRHLTAGNVGQRGRYRRRRALVRAAFLAAADRLAAPLVRAAFRAAAERAEAERREAARRACFESAVRDAVLRGSRFSARDTARETRGRRRGFRLPCPTS
jgi:hypothetical protein